MWMFGELDCAEDLNPQKVERNIFIKYGDAAAKISQQWSSTDTRTVC